VKKKTLLGGEAASRRFEDLEGTTPSVGIGMNVVS